MDYASCFDLALLAQNISRIINKNISWISSGNIRLSSLLI
jgi:hypothetical protein